MYGDLGFRVLSLARQTSVAWMYKRSFFLGPKSLPQPENQMTLMVGHAFSLPYPTPPHPCPKEEFASGRRLGRSSEN